MTADVHDAVEAAEFAKRGTWPTLAGTLDQPAVLLEAFRVIWNEEEAHRAELGLNRDE